MLGNIVYNFMRRRSEQTMSAEDLMQEARPAFLQHIRTHRPEDYKRCRLTILHALCDAVLKHYPVSIPRGVFFGGARKCQRRAAASLEEAQYIARDGGYDALDLAAQIMEAAQQLGMTDVQASRMLKRIRRLLEDDAA